MSKQKFKRYRRTLEFIERYGIATTEVLDKHCYAGNENVRKQELAKGVRCGDLQAFPLYGNAKYYTIGPNAKKRYSLKAPVGPKGYGPAVLPKHAAIMDYCTAADALDSRLLLKRTEFMTAFPELTEGLANFQDRYFFEFDESGSPRRLATFVVDAAVKVRTLTSKMRSISKRRHSNKSFRLLHDEGAFFVVVITHCQARVAEINEALVSPHRKRPTVPIEVFVSPLLQEVINHDSGK